MIPFVLVDKGCGLDPALLHDIAEMCSVVSQTEFSKPEPYGYGVAGTVRVAQSPTDIGAGEWVLAFEPQPTVQGALGYHDNAANGMPQGHVFPSLETSLDDLPVTVAHEFFEMLGDADCNTAIAGADNVVRCKEACDPVEAQSFPYKCQSGRVLACSNWVTPAWFTGAAEGAPLDHLGQVAFAGQVLPGGYEITWGPNGWAQQVNGAVRAYRKQLADLGIGRHSRRAAKARPDGLLDSLKLEIDRAMKP